MSRKKIHTHKLPEGDVVTFQRDDTNVFANSPSAIVMTVKGWTKLRADSGITYLETARVDVETQVSIPMQDAAAMRDSLDDLLKRVPKAS